MNSIVMQLDDYGRPAWIAVMVLAFILFWPIGLAILAFLIWSGRMGCSGNSGRNNVWGPGSDRWQRKMQRFQSKMEGWGGSFRGFPPSGNAAFDDYREETLRRLEDEQRDFQGFLDRLRKAKDKAEFDQFMADRRNRPKSEPEAGPEAPTSTPSS